MSYLVPDAGCLADHAREVAARSVSKPMNVLDAWTAAERADRLWADEMEKAGLTRRSPNWDGEPGTALRAAYDAKIAADAEYSRSLRAEEARGGRLI